MGFQMDFFKIVNHFFNGKREVIQNVSSPEWGRWSQLIFRFIASK